MRWLRKLKKLFFEDVALSLSAVAVCTAAWLLGQAFPAARGWMLVGGLLVSLAVNVMGAVRAARLTR